MTTSKKRSNWTNCGQIQKSTIEDSGIYRVRWMRGSRPIHPNRCLGRDDLGILAIGKAISLNTRRAAFVRAVESTSANHSEGKLLGILVGYSTFPHNVLKQLFWECRVCRTKGLAYEEELEIKRYILSFGQTPPLNCAIPNRFGEWPGQLSLI